MDPCTRPQYFGKWQVDTGTERCSVGRTYSLLLAGSIWVLKFCSTFAQLSSVQPTTKSTRQPVICGTCPGVMSWLCRSHFGSAVLFGNFPAGYSSANHPVAAWRVIWWTMPETVFRMNVQRLLSRLRHSSLSGLSFCHGL